MKYIFIALIFLLFAACSKPEFFPDQYNPGLSRFTSRDYNVASVYVNDSVWISDLHRWQSMLVYLQETTNPAADTLNIGWSGYFGDNNSQGNNMNQTFLRFSIPVKKNFTRANFFNWNGKQLPDNSTPVTVSLSGVPNFISSNPTQAIGSGKIYFVKITPDSSGVALSGLFEGNIGDTIILRKGRFDFFVNNSNIGLR